MKMLLHLLIDFLLLLYKYGTVTGRFGKASSPSCIPVDEKCYNVSRSEHAKDTTRFCLPSDPFSICMEFCITVEKNIEIKYCLNQVCKL